jgi:ABC-type lipoprotein release transport system permease subunit
VCAVGIVNAMLMSVTERFREIGTMKCLGALDSFVIKLFLIESSLQGMTGTIFGVVVGSMLTLAWSLVSFRLWVIEYFPGRDVFKFALLSFLIGSFLSVAGAVAPALKAANMQPVDAMRVEE